MCRGSRDTRPRQDSSEKVDFQFHLPQAMEVEVVMSLRRSFTMNGRVALKALEPAAVPTRETVKVLTNVAADSATCSESAMIYLFAFC